MLFLIKGTRKEERKYSGKDLFSDSFYNIVVNEPNTYLRGSILIKDRGYISVDSKLISNPQNFQNWDSHAPSISFSDQPYMPKLWDVPFPYYISKIAYSDTFTVNKDNFTLYFLLDSSKK